MCSPRKSNENFSIFTFYESKQMSLTQDLRWSLGRSIALQLQRQTDLLLCTINCFLQWDHLPNMAVGDLAFYYTLYLWLQQDLPHNTVGAEFPQCTLIATPTCSSHSGNVIYETYLAGQEKSECTCSRQCGSQQKQNTTNNIMITKELNC